MGAYQAPAHTRAKVYNELMTNTHQHNDDIFNPTRDEPHLPGDGTTPAAPANDTSKMRIDPTDPRTDSDIDSAELYDAGLTTAASADTPEDSDDIERGERIG